VSEESSILNALADALDAASATLRRHAVGLARDQDDAPARTNTPDDVVSRARRARPSLGQLQAPVLWHLADAHPEWLDSTVLWHRVGTDKVDRPNLYNTCQKLMELTWVEKDPTTRPHRYRLTDVLLVVEEAV
jgi:hypothetical protein